MVVLKDFYCSECGFTSEHITESNLSATIIKCKKCKKQTQHYSICNGGTKTRWRFMDWYGVNFREHISLETPVVKHLDPEGKGELVDATFNNNPDKKIVEQDRFSKDGLKEGLEKKYFETDKKQGKTPIHIDLKKR